MYKRQGPDLLGLTFRTTPCERSSPANPVLANAPHPERALRPLPARAGRGDVVTSTLERAAEPRDLGDAGVVGVQHLELARHRRRLGEAPLPGQRREHRQPQLGREDAVGEPLQRALPAREGRRVVTATRRQPPELEQRDLRAELITLRRALETARTRLDARIAAFVGLFLRVAIPRPVLVLGLGLIIIFELIAFAAGYFRLRPLSIARAESVLERTLGRVFLLHLGVFIGVFLAAAFASWFVWPFIVLKTITDVGQALQALGRRETDGAPEAPAT